MVKTQIKKTNRNIKKIKKTLKMKGGFRDLVDINRLGNIKIKRKEGLLSLVSLKSWQGENKEKYDPLLEKLKIYNKSDGTDGFETFYGVGKFNSALAFGADNKIKNIDPCADIKFATYSIIRRSVMEFLITKNVHCHSIENTTLIIFTIEKFKENQRGGGITGSFSASVGNFFNKNYDNARNRFSVSFGYNIIVNMKIPNYNAQANYKEQKAEAAGQGTSQKEDFKDASNVEFWYNFKPYIPKNVKYDRPSTYITEFEPTAIKLA
jgi:hypothetical protein